MKMLSRAEEIILTAILQLKGNAYGITIRDYIKDVTGYEWSFASIYDPLNKLFRKQYVRKITAEPTAERGGRRKILYEITPGGIEALREIRNVNENIWERIPKTALK
ncbi:MAG: PadR family transcriptional regulator [bacterium]|nr:PadR family transcriptional regulator [bacterium]